MDYTAIFYQVTIANDVYTVFPKEWQQLNKMGLPTLFKENHVLNFNRSLYGLRDSPRNFFKHLQGKLKQCKFIQSSHDPCLFIGTKLICVVYADDYLFFSPSYSDIDQKNENIRQTGMTLNAEDDVVGSLGVHIYHEENGCVTLI